MSQISKTSASVPKPKATGTTMSTAVKGVAPSLRKFWDFANNMARQFSRHLSKDRSAEMLEDIRKHWES